MVTPIVKKNTPTDKGSSELACYEPDHYEQGFLMAISLLMLTHGSEVEAIDVLQEGGLLTADVSYFEEFDKRQFRKLQGSRGVNFKGLQQCDPVFHCTGLLYIGGSENEM